jgi:polyhydroxyalkanoate synthesis repressor PhaR
MPRRSTGRMQCKKTWSQTGLGVLGSGSVKRSPTGEAKHVAGRNSTGPDEPIVIKKYANRRLYNTATSSYVTLEHLCQMVKDDVDFVVYDAKSGTDITRPVLTQIIVEEESKGQNLLPINFLRQLIGFYGDNLQWVVPSYLEHMMSSFTTNQDGMRQSMQDAFGGVFPVSNLEDMGKQNMALFENAMKMFSPYGMKPPESGQSTDTTKPVAAQPPESEAAATKDAESLAELKEQVAQLQKQLEILSQNQSKR